MPDDTYSEIRDRITPTIGLKEAAALLRCHPDTVRKMAKARELPAAKVGRAWVFYTESLLRWLQERCESRQPIGDDPMRSPGSRLAERLRADLERRQREQDQKAR